MEKAGPTTGHSGAERDSHVAKLSTVDVKMPDPGADGWYAAWVRRVSPAMLGSLVAASVALGLAYAPNFRDLMATWGSDPNYSHGYLVIPIAVLILFKRLSTVDPET